MGVKTMFEYYSRMRSVAREIEELRDNRKPTDVPIIMIIDEDGNDHCNVEITKKEWGAIRRYLIRNRVRLLNDEGILT